LTSQEEIRLRERLNPPRDEFLDAPYSQDAAELLKHCQALRRRISDHNVDTLKLAPDIVDRLWDTMRRLGGTPPSPKPGAVRAIHAGDVLLVDEHGRTDCEGAIEAFDRAIDTVVAWCEEKERERHKRTPDGLSPTKKRILSMCRRKALPATAIAHKLELSYDHTRRVLAQLRKAGLLRTDELGYRTVRAT
jgi:hypothetical protein